MASRWFDAVVAGVFAAAGFVIGGAYTRLPAVIAAASFYQETMGPSVMLACGRGLSSTEALANSGTPAAALLTAFLERKADRFDCSALPAGIESRRLTALQSASRYLLIAVGTAWRVSEVSWSGLWWFFGVLHGAVAALAYLSSRTILRPGLSALVTVFLLTSSLQLSALPHLRDYSKAPFFTAMCLATLHVVVRPVSSRGLLAWSAVAGALTGIAFGVRFDTVLFLAFFLGALLLFMPGAVRAPRVVAVSVAIATFLVVALPVLLSFELGNNSWHVIILGLAEPHWSALGIAPSVYQLGSLYNDSFVSATVNGAWQGAHGAGPLLRLDTALYGQAAGEYFLQVARVFPADLVTRGWAAVLQLFRLPFDQSLTLPGGMPPDGALSGLLSARAGMMSWLLWLAPWAAVLPLAATLGLAAFSVRLSLLGISAWLFFGGMSSLQFQARHVFHLELLTLVFSALALQSFATALGHAVRSRRAENGERTRNALRAALPVTALSLALALTVVVPLAALRGWQQETVRSLLGSYSGGLPASGDGTRTDLPGGLTLIAPSENGHDQVGPLRAQLLAADFGGAACDYDEVLGTIRYRAASQAADFSRPLTVPIPESPAQTTRVWFAAYDFQGTGGEGYQLAGIELPAGRATCLTRLVRAPARERFPLLVDATLAPGWDQLPLYATLVNWEAAGAARRTTYKWPPNDAGPTRSELGRQLSALEPADYVGRIASVTAGPRVAVRGWAPAVAYLVSWPPSARNHSALFVAEGELTAGSVSVGLERDGQWEAQVPLGQPGRFRVVIRVPGAGSFRPVIANNRTGGVPWTNLTIDRIGWLR